MRPEQAPAATEDSVTRSSHPAVFLAALAALVYWGFLAWPNFKFAHDDFVLFTFARLHGPGRMLAFLNVFGHFAPLNHLLYWFELAAAPLDVVFGFAVGAAFVLTMLLAFIWLMSELGVTWRRQAVAVVVLALAITTMVIGTWWGVVVHVPLSLAALFMILAAHVRAGRLHSVPWHTASIAFLVFGLLLQERAGFAIGIAVALDLFVVWRSMTLRSALRRLLSVSWALIVMSAIVVPWYLYALKNYAAHVPAARLDDVARFFPISFGRYFLPAVLGFYVGSTGVPAWLIVLLVLVAVAGSLVLVATRRDNVKLLMFFIAVYVIYYGLVAVGRLGLYSIEDEGSDLQYAAYVLPFLVLAVATATFPRLPMVRWRAAMAPVAALLLTACLAVDDAVLAAPGAMLAVSQGAHRWEIGLAASKPEWTARSVGIIPLRVPTEVAAAFVDPYGREETFLHLVEPGLAVGALPGGAHWALIDETAAVRRAALRPEVVLTGPDIARLASPFAGMKVFTGRQMGFPAVGLACFTATRPGAGLSLSLPRQVDGVPLMVELRAYVSRPTSLRFGSSAPGILNVNALVGTMSPADSDVVYNLDGRTMNLVSLGEMTPGTTICLQSLAIVRPVVVDGATCRFVDRYGHAQDEVGCPPAGVASVADQEAASVVVEVEADLREAFLHHRLS